MLTTLATVKNRLQLDEATVKYDALLNLWLARVTGRFENETNRTFARTVDYQYEFGGADTEILPPLYPIEMVSAWELKTNETDGWLPQTNVDYLLRRKAVLSLSTALGVEKAIGRVTYTGGYILPATTAPEWDPLPIYNTGEIVLHQDLPWLAQELVGAGNVPGDGTGYWQALPWLPNDLEGAAVEQITYWFQNRDRLGLVSVSGEGGSLSQFAKLDLLPSVQATLKNQTRWLN